MPEPLDARDITATSSAPIVNEAVSTTSTADTVSPIAEHVSESHSSLVRLVNTVLRNVKETSIVESAYSYVKDVNERSPLVRAVSDYAQPFLDKAAPMVVSVVDRIDDSIDATTGRIVDESTEIMTEIFTRKDQVKRKVGSTIEGTKSAVSTRITSIVRASQDIIIEFRKRRDSLYAEIVRRKDSLAEELHHLQTCSGLQTTFQFPSKSIAYVQTSIHQQLASFADKARLVVTRFCTYRDETLLVIQNYCETNPHVLQFHEIITQQYIVMCLRWNDVKIRLLMQWADLTTNGTVSRLHKKFIELLFKTRESFQNGCVISQEKTAALVGKVMSTGQDLLLNVPEEKRQLAQDFYVQVCCKVRSSIGDEKTDAVANYLLDSTVAAWLRKAALAASA